MAMIRRTVPAREVRVADRLMGEPRQPLVISGHTVKGTTTIRCAGASTIEVPASMPMDVQRRTRTIEEEPDYVRPREIPQVQHRDRIATPDRRVTMPEFTEPQLTREA